MIEARCIGYSNQAKRDAKKHFQLLMSTEWVEVLYHLTRDEKLPAKYRNHALTGNWTGFSECHIKPDFLMVYRLEEGFVKIARLGSHSEIFR